MNLRFLFISILLFVIVVMSEYTAYASFHYVKIIKSTGLEKILLVLSLILPIVFIVSMIYGYKHYSIINSFINTISSVWIGFVIYALIASLIVFILIMLNTHLNLQIPVNLISKILISLVFIIIIYGIWNSQKIRVVHLEINSPALSQNWQGKKIVIISDVHLGQIRGEKFFQKIIKKINKENPDVVFILGDLIDGASFPYEKWLSQMSLSRPQFGNIYVEGNHEKYNQEYDKFKSSIPDSIINISDKKIEINNTQIIGIDYKQEETENDIKSKLELLKYNKDKPSIVLIHDPKNVKVLADEGVNLVLSGHTHGGQFFPFTILVNLIYKNYTHGITQTENTTSITSYGIGTSILPLRIGTVPEIIVLTIK